MKEQGTMELMAMFVRDIKKVPILCREEEFVTVSKAQSGDVKAYQLLIAANLRFVLKVANRYFNSEIPLTDLVAAGYMGLIQSIKKFDPDKGFRFISYAEFGVKHSIFATIKNYWKHAVESLDEPAYKDNPEESKKDLLVSIGIKSDEYAAHGQMKDWLDQLTDRERKVLHLRFWEDMDTVEIAKIMGISTTSVRNTEAKALRTLRWNNSGYQKGLS